MGNCFGKPDKSFEGEGRMLGSAPANVPSRPGNASASVPPKITSPQGGKTLGKNPQIPGESASPKEAAARAAEERAKATQSQNKGKLGKQLDAQRMQTQRETLAQNARDNVAVRDADAAAQTRNWN